MLFTRRKYSCTDNEATLEKICMSKFAFRVGSKEKVFVFLLSSPEPNAYQVSL